MQALSPHRRPHSPRAVFAYSISERLGKMRKRILTYVMGVLVALSVCMLGGVGRAAAAEAEAASGNAAKASAAATLQKQIDDAPDGGTVTITSDLALDATINIPAGKTVTVTDDGSARTLSSTAEPMFQVDGALTIAATADDHLVFKGTSIQAAQQGSIATVTGSLDLRHGTLTGGPVKAGFEGVVVVRGGDFTMSGGIIADQTIAEHASVAAAAVVVMENDANKGSTFKLSGGTITNNATHVAVIASRSSVIMSGGTIDHNAGTGIQGVFSSSVTFSGGTISNNGGSGIYVNTKSRLEMTGGTITGNTTAGSGGGISAQDVEALNIYAGTITNNTAGNFGGGIYIDSTRALAHIDGALVTGNTATLMGGGLWCCPTSKATVNVTDGMAVFDNTVSGNPGAGEDFVNLDQSASEGAVVTVASRMLGGGLTTFYRDGGITYNPHGSGFWGKWDADPAAPRFDAMNPGEPVLVDGVRVSRALKAMPSEGAKAAALAAATTIITGNTSKSGGGIATNGSFASGIKEEWELTVDKAWDDAVEASERGDVPVYLVINGEPLDYVMLTADNGYHGSFTGLPDPASVKSVAVMESTVAEDGTVSPTEPTNTWKISYSSIATDADAKKMSATVTNAPKPETVSIPVTKKWVGGTGDAVTVHLLADGVDTGKTLTLTQEGNWTGSFDELLKKQDDHKIVYTVVEDAVEGYTSKVTGDAASGFTVTNTKNPTPNKPHDKPKKPSDKPNKPQSSAKLPKTGDTSGLAGILAAAAFVPLAAALTFQRTRRAAEATGKRCDRNRSK